jgi:hypothetical protein
MIKSNENNNINNHSVGDTKKVNRKINPVVHELKMKIAFFTIGIIAYIGLFVMGVSQKIIELFKRD